MPTRITTADDASLQEAFLSELPNFGSPFPTLTSLGIPPARYCKWLATSPSFRATLQQILSGCVDLVAHTLFDLAISATNPKVKDADRISAAKVYLQHRGALKSSLGLELSPASTNAPQLTLVEIAKAIADYSPTNTSTDTSPPLQAQAQAQAQEQEDPNAPSPLLPP